MKLISGVLYHDSIAVPGTNVHVSSPERLIEILELFLAGCSEIS